MATRDRTLAQVPKPSAPAAKAEHASAPKPHIPRPVATPGVGWRAAPPPASALAVLSPTKRTQSVSERSVISKPASPQTPLRPTPMPSTPKAVTTPIREAPANKERSTARTPATTLAPSKSLGVGKALTERVPLAEKQVIVMQLPVIQLGAELGVPSKKPDAGKKSAPATVADAGAVEEPTTPEKSSKPEGKKTEGDGSKEPEAPVKEKGEGKGGEHKKAKGGEHAEAGEPGKGTAGGAGGVQLKMPEPPTAPSPATQKRISKVKTAAGGATAVQTALPTAPQSASQARGAVDEPPQEANAKAQRDLVAKLDAQPAPSPEIEEICKKIKDVIKSKRPPDEDSLVKADPKAMANAASGDVKGGVEGETKKVETSYNDINQSPQGVPAKGQEMVPPPTAVDSPPVNAIQATPDAVPAQNVSLKADSADSKQNMDDAGMNKPAAQLVKSGPIADARGAQGELEQKAEQDPALVLAKQQEALGKAQGDMAALQEQALAALTSSRKTTVHGTTGHQKGMVVSEEQQRTQASADAQKIFQEAQSKVDALLKDVTPKAMQVWDQKIEILTTEFKQHLKKVEDWIADRHSGFGGSLVSLWDDVTGLPGWVTDEYDKAEETFGNGVCGLAREISVQVNGVIMACEAIIKQARKDIADIFAKQPESLRAWAEGEQAKLGEQLDGLNHKAQQTRTDFNKQIVDRASQAVQDVREQIHALREAAKGLIGKIKDAIKRFIDDPIKFIIDGLLELVGIAPASFWALVNKIRQVISDIADDPEKFANNLFKGLAMGFSQFFDNFPEHLKKGFLDWLLGGIAAAGINLPKDFSLKSIITFFLELMGITWPNIRKILAKHVGEKNIALIEKVVSLMFTLIELGPSGVFDLIKEKLNPAEILKQIVKMAIDYLVEALIKQAVARIVALFNPVGAILQAIEAIYRVLKWIFHNAARIFKLIETVVDGIADIMAGNLGGFANAVEKGLAMLIAPVIDFIADYLGLGDLPAKVKEKIEGFQQIVLGYVEQAIVFLIEKGKALLKFIGIGGKEKDADKKKDLGTVDQGIGETISFTADGQSHQLWMQETSGRVVVMVKSDPTPVLELLSMFEAKITGKTDKASEKAQKLIGVARGKSKETEQKGAEEKRVEEKAKTGDQSATNAAIADHKKTVQSESTLGDVLGEIFALVHGGDNILGLLDKQIITRGIKGPDKIKDHDAVNQLTAAKYVVYTQERNEKDKYFVRRSDVPKDESERPQVNFTERKGEDAGGRLALGAGTAKTSEDEKIKVYEQLLGFAGLPKLTEELDADLYREAARTRIVQKLVKGGSKALLDFMNVSKQVPSSYNRLRGDIYDEWLVASGTRSYSRPGPMFRKKDYPELDQDRQPDGSRGKRIYDAKGHGGLGPNGDEMAQYRDYLKIINNEESGYTGLVYVILDSEARDKWESKCPQAMFAP